MKGPSQDSHHPSCSDAKNNPVTDLKLAPPHSLEFGAEIHLKISNVFLLSDILVQKFKDHVILCSIPAPTAPGQSSRAGVGLDCTSEILGLV